MRYIELLVTDFVDEERTPITWTEWIARDHIETIEPYTTGNAAPCALWLEISLTSGRTRFVPLGIVEPTEIDDAARRSIAALLEHGTEPVRAAAADGPDPTSPDADPQKVLASPPRLDE